MSFNKIRGHDTAIKILKDDIDNSRLAGSYLFIGPEGVGKITVARELAKFINCLDHDNNDSCDRCLSCRKIDANVHPDVHLIDVGIDNKNPSVPSGDYIKIEQIRQLQKDIYLRPYQAKVKIFIINNAHHMTLEACNAFLKTLEEPPKDSLIILVTSNLRFLPDTVISRCQKLKFASLQKGLLKQILNEEYKLDYNLSHYLAYFCEGRLGKALNLKDKDALVNKNQIIDYFTNPADSAAAYVNSNRKSSNFEFNKSKIRDSFEILASWFRDIYFIKIGMPYSELVNIDRKNDLVDIMHRYTPAGLESIFNFICESVYYLEQNVNQILLLNNLRIILRPR